MRTPTLTGKVAWCQFSPFMRLLEGYRGRESSNLSEDELLQTWKSIVRYRDWMSFLAETTGLSNHDCLIAMSIIHFVAATNRKLMDRHSIGERDIKLSFVFLPRLIECLPSICLLLLRYIVKLTLDDAQDRNTPYDQLQHTGNHGWRGHTLPQERELGRQAKFFLLNCVTGSTSLLLDVYRPMYNNMADERYYDRWMLVTSTKMAYLMQFLTHPTKSGQDYNSIKPLMGCLAFHVRLVELCEDMESLQPVHHKNERLHSLEERLTFENTRMRNIDEQVIGYFSDSNSTSEAIRSLDLEEIGRSLKAVYVGADVIPTEDIISTVGDKHSDKYQLDRWGTDHAANGSV